MKSILSAIHAFAVGIGGPGLFLIAFLDSSFLSFPQVNDLLIVLMVARAPSWMLYYAAMSTLGSLAGSLVIYEVARRGGQAFLRRRLSPRRIERGVRLFDRYGVLTVLVLSVLPPPAPFKLFVLLAGVTRMARWPFALSILAGRGARYLLIGLLTVWYGERALQFLRTNGPLVAWVAAAIVVTGAGAWYLVRRRRGGQAPAEAAAVDRL